MEILRHFFFNGYNRQIYENNKTEVRVVLDIETI